MMEPLFLHDLGVNSRCSILPIRTDTILTQNGGSSWEIDAGVGGDRRPCRRGRVQAEGHRGVDQYVLWINKHTGQVDRAEYTIRELASSFLGASEYSASARSRAWSSRGGSDWSQAAARESRSHSPGRTPFPAPLRPGCNSPANRRRFWPDRETWHGGQVPCSSVTTGQRWHLTELSEGPRWACFFDEAAIERLAITDPRISVAEDLDRLRAARILPDELVVAGYAYDVTDGHVREIIAPASLRKGAGS